MAVSSPRVGSKSTLVTVAVVGLTSSSLGDQGEGAGKSCLCNGFVWPHADHYHRNHPYIVNYSEFGNSVINSCHFLYWGEKITALEDGSEVCFRVIEHTEFVEDMSLKPFSSQKPYHKRIATIKLQSGGKLQYVAPNQLTLPDDYPNVSRFPDRTVLVDGFVLCMDVSAPFGPSDPQRDTFNKLIASIQSIKKPLVIALTKCDRVTSDMLTAVIDTITKIKRVPPIVEVSAHEGVNVDLCFLVLAHLVDSRKPKSRIIPFEEGLATVKQRTRKNETAFNELLNHKLTDFTLSNTKAIEMVCKDSEWHSVAQIKGEERSKKLVRIKMGQLYLEAVDKQGEIFFEVLPQFLQVVLPNASLDDDYESCKAALQTHPDFDKYFVHVENWQDNTEFMYACANKVPMSFLENEGKKFLEQRILQLHLKEEQRLAKDKIREALANTEDLQPGVKAMVAIESLGLSAQAQLLEPDVLQKIYQERMNVIEQKCGEDIHELLLERLDLFHEYTPDTKEIIEKLRDEPRMKRMELAVTKRDGIIVKHISTLEVLSRGPYFTPELLAEISKTCPSLESLRDSISGHWSCNPNSDTFNLALLSQYSEETAILRSDIMNQCTGADMYEFNNKSYHLRMKCFSVDVETITTEKFVPQGAIFIISCLKGLEWAGSFISRLFLCSSSSSSSSSSYRGLPCVLLVIDDQMFEGKSESALFNQSKQLSAQLQCVYVLARPTDLPGRLVPQDVVNAVLPSLFDNVVITSSFLFDGPVREVDGLNFGVFSLPGDPINVEYLGSFLSSQQLVHYDEDKRTLFMKTALERQHKVASLAFYSTINARDFSSHPTLGFIIFYSANRKASLSAVKWLIPRLHSIHILLVAIATDNSSPLVDEGEKLAKEWKKIQFVVCQKDLSISHLVEFYSTCFFSRFSSWRSQKLSEEVSTRIFRRKHGHLPPTRPLPDPTGNFTFPHMSSRHSIAGILTDSEGSITSPKLSVPLFSTLSRSPSKDQYNQSIHPEEDSLYSSPSDIKQTMRGPLSPLRGGSLKQTHRIIMSPEHQYKSSPAIAQSVPNKTGAHFNTLPPNSHPSGYAIIPDAETIGKLDTLTRQRRQTPDENALYSPVRDTGGRVKKHSYDAMVAPLEGNPINNTPPPIYPKTTIYDRLTPRTRRKLQQQGKIPTSNGGIYSLAGSENNTYSVATEGIHQIPSSNHPPNVYNTFNSTQIQLHQLGQELYDVVESVESTPRSQIPMPMYDVAGSSDVHTDMNQPLQMYSYTVPTFDKSPSPQRKSSPSSGHVSPTYSYSVHTTDDSRSTQELYSYATVNQKTKYTQQQHLGTRDSVYSLANDSSPPLSRKRSPTPPTRVTSVPPKQTPTPPMTKPLVPPKPRPKPKPGGGILRYQRKSPPGTPFTRTSRKEKTPPGTPPIARAIHHIVPDQNPEALYAIPDKPKTMPPQIQHIVHDDNPDLIYAVPEKPSVRKISQPNIRGATPTNIDDDDDDDDEEAPPLPPRNYDYSDIEDEDEDIFQSDDDLEDDAPLFFIQQQPIPMYASAGEINDELTLHAPSSHMDRTSTALDEIENIYQNLNKLRHQLGYGTQESIYDTLDKVVEAVQQMQHTPNGGPMRDGSTQLPTTKMPTGATMPFLSKNALKLMKKMEKKAHREAQRRKRQDGKRRKKEEEEKKKMEKALKKGKKYKAKTRKRYFESPLSCVVEEDGVPAFVKKCVTIVERDGMNTEGLYRISGKKEDIMILQEKYDQDPQIDIDSVNLYVTAVTSTLKAFFKVLPDPLILDTVLPALLDIPGYDRQSQKEKMRQILSNLPRENIKTLRYLALHLNKVQKNQEVNKMNASNLSIVFWPTLMRPPLMDLADSTKQIGWQLSMARIIEDPDFVPEVE